MTSIRVYRRPLLTHHPKGKGGVSMKRTVGNNTGIYGPRFGPRPNNTVRGGR